MEANLRSELPTTNDASGGRVLFHSYYFPPIGGSGAQRPLRMVRGLASLGYRAVVITGGGATEDRWAPEDRTLVADLPAGLDVRRLDAASEPGGSSRWRGRAERWLSLRSRWSRWWVESSVELGIQASNDIDLIYVRRVAEEIGRVLRSKAGAHTVVFRSTMVPGTPEGVRIP